MPEVVTEEHRSSSSESLASNNATLTAEERKSYKAIDVTPSPLLLDPSPSLLGLRRNVKSLPMLNCTASVAASIPTVVVQGQRSPATPNRPDRRSEPIQIPSTTSATSAKVDQTEPRRHKTLNELNKGLGSIFHNNNTSGGLAASNSTVAATAQIKSPAVARRSVPDFAGGSSGGGEKSSPILRRAKLSEGGSGVSGGGGENLSPSLLRRHRTESKGEKSSPALKRATTRLADEGRKTSQHDETSFVARSRHNSGLVEDFGDLGRPRSRRPNFDEPARDVNSRPGSRRSHIAPEDLLDISGGPTSRPPSRRQHYDDQGMRWLEKPTARRQDEVNHETEEKKSLAAVRIGRRGLVKSLSRQSLYDEPGGGGGPDDIDVYHTITGGRSNFIAASRAPLPFAKITRRPARLVVAGIPSMVDEVDFDGEDTESVYSLNEDMWRVSACPILGAENNRGGCVVRTVCVMYSIYLGSNLIWEVIMYFFITRFLVAVRYVHSVYAFQFNNLKMRNIPLMQLSA